MLTIFGFNTYSVVLLQDIIQDILQYIVLAFLSNNVSDQNAQETEVCTKPERVLKTFARSWYDKITVYIRASVDLVLDLG